MLVKESLNSFLNEKEDPKAKIRNRGDVVLSADSKFVKDHADHFPINSSDQARNAWARVNQYDSSPGWFEGDLDSLKKKVKSAVTRKYPDIKINEKLNETDVYEHVWEFKQDLKRGFPDLQDFNYKEEENYIELPLDEYSTDGMNALDDAVRELVNDKYAASGWVVIDDNSLEQMFGDNWPEESPFFNEENIYVKLPEYLVEMDGGKAEEEGTTEDDVDIYIGDKFFALYKNKTISRHICTTFDGNSNLKLCPVFFAKL